MEPVVKLRNDKRYIFIIAGLFLFWFIMSLLLPRGSLYTPSGDSQRDTGIIYNVIAGNIFGDSAYRGERAYYPTLMHAVYALIYLITHIPVQTLVSSYPIIITLPVILMLMFVFYAIYRSYAYTALALFASTIIIARTSESLLPFTHPTTFAISTFVLGIFLFWRALVKQRITDWILAGVGIALNIYAHPVSSIILCSAITAYQLVNRKHWKKFCTMVAVSFVVASPYLLPLLLSYQVIPRNTIGTDYYGGLNLPNEELRNIFFYGYGNIRWFNCFFILTGIFASIKRKYYIDKIILSLYGISVAIVLVSIGIIKGMIPKILPILVLGEFQLYNSVIAVFLFSSGVWYWQSKATNKLLFVGIVVICVVFSLPPYVSLLQNKRAIFLSGNYKEPDWFALSQWINAHTQIDDVFLTTPDRSYFYILGMTGRKTVAIIASHANPFVNQQERENDLIILYDTTDMNTFRVIAKKYQLGFVIVSPYEQAMSVNGLSKFSQDPFFDEVFTSGGLHLYKLNWQTENYL